MSCRLSDSVPGWEARLPRVPDGERPGERPEPGGRPGLPGEPVLLPGDFPGLPCCDPMGLGGVRGGGSWGLSWR